MITYEELERQFGHGSLVKPISTAKVIEVFGSENSVGKTTLALHRAAIVQKNGGTVLYIDSDNTLDYTYAKSMEIDPSKLLVCIENKATRIFNLIEALARENKISLIIVDTITALMFPDRFGEGFTRLVGLITKSNMDVMFLHQIRWGYESRSNIRSLIQIQIERDKTFKTWSGKVSGYRYTVVVNMGNLILQRYIFEVKQIDKKYHITTVGS